MNAAAILAAIGTVPDSLPCSRVLGWVATRLRSDPDALAERSLRCCRRRVRAAAVTRVPAVCEAIARAKADIDRCPPAVSHGPCTRALLDREPRRSTRSTAPPVTARRGS